MSDLLNLNQDGLVNSPVQLLLVANQNWPQAVSGHIGQTSVPELVQGNGGLFLIEETQELIHFRIRILLWFSSIVIALAEAFKPETTRHDICILPRLAPILIRRLAGAWLQICLVRLVLLLVERLWTPGSFELLLLGQVMEPTLGLNEVKDSFFQLRVVKMDFLIVVEFSCQRIPVFLQMVQYFSFPNIFDALWTLISLVDLQFEF